MSLAFITLGLTAPPVLAQQPPSHCWTITYSQTGTWNHSARDSPSLGQTGPIVTDDWPVSYNPNSGDFFGGAGNLINGDMEGIVTATLTWNPATGQTLATDPPAEPVIIDESAIATDSPSWGGYGPAPIGQGTADDGLGDTSVANGNGRTSSGTRIITQDGTSGIIHVTDTLSAVAPTSTFTFYQPSGYGGGWWDWKACSCSVAFSVAIDTHVRAVSIRSPIEASFAKGPADEFGYCGPSPDVRNSDGSITVDSAVSWHDASSGDIDSPGFAQGWQINNLPLTATPINFLTSYPAYSWSLQGLSQGWLEATANNPTYFYLLEPDWTKFPLQGTVTVNATDSDGTVASNTYTMRLHLPYENWQPTGTDAPVWQLSPLEGTPGFPSGTTGPGGTISGQWSFTEDTNGKGIGVGDMFAAASGLVDPPWAAFIALTGIVFSKTQSESPVHGVSFDSSVWGKDHSTFSDGSRPPDWPNSSLDTMTKYQMSPRMFLEYQPSIMRAINTTYTDTSARFLKATISGSAGTLREISP